MNNTEKAALLRELAADHDLMWEVARSAVEDLLVEMRDSRISMPTRGNGFVIREEDGKSSDIIRFGPEIGISHALKALADHFDPPKGD
jgi:hypothetical protein